MGGWRGLLEWLGIFWPGVSVRACLTLADAAVTAVTLADSPTWTVALADAATSVVALADSKCEG